MSEDLSNFFSGTGLTFGTIGGLFTTQILQICKGLVVDPLAEQYFPKKCFVKYFNDPLVPEENQPSWGLVIREVLIWVCIICFLFILYCLITSGSSQQIPPELLQQLAARGEI